MWITDGNQCREGTVLLDNGLGYSEKECCFELCGDWNQRTITPKLQTRFPEILDETINTLFTVNEPEWTTYNYIEKVKELQEDIIDTGTPVNISNCESGQKLFSERRGIDSDTCCINTYETCSTKKWKCPENKYTDISSLSKECVSSPYDRCPDTADNIEICCSEYQKCSDFTCPPGYIVNSQTKDEFCKGPLCSVEDDLDCCIVKEKCSKLYCGFGYQTNRLHEHKYCKNEICTILDDKETCCIKNQTCSSMACPIGYYQRSKNKDTLCWDGKCDPDNKLDMLMCCEKCTPVPNATIYTCDKEGTSTAVECNAFYSLDGGVCLSDKELLDISLTLDGDYGNFISDRNHMEKAKEELCRKMGAFLEFDECVEVLTITELKKGSVIINFQIVNEGQSMNVKQVEQLFSKGVFLDGLNMKIKETPIIKTIEPVSLAPKCVSDTYKYNCHYGLILKENAGDIYGYSDKECCRLDWGILKVVTSIFLIGILLIFIIYQLTLGKFIKRKSL